MTEFVPQQRQKKAEHQFSTETLYHFRCGQCLQWWTMTYYIEGEVACPHCFTAALAKPITSADDLGL